MSIGLSLPDTALTVPETLAFWASHTADAPAFIVPGQPALSYETLWRNAWSLAESLHRSGVARHDRVVLLLPEGPLLATALLGTMCAAIAVPLPASLTLSELRASLDRLRATTALATLEIAATTRDYLQQQGVRVITLEANARLLTDTLQDQGTPATPLTWPDHAETALVCQTSGTTGKPKRVPRTHSSLIEVGKLLHDQFGLQPADRTAAVAPMALSLGQTVLMQVLATGGSLIFPPPTDVAQQWEIVERERPTWLSAAAGFLELLARCLEARPPRSDPSSLRFVLVTSAAISPVICDRLTSHLGAPIYPRYSSSETGAVAMALPPPAAPLKPGSVGQLVQEVLIVDADGHAVDPNSEGEICVRGPRVFSGYLDDADANAAAFRPGGWFCTGDIGYLDEEGYLFLTGRGNELINRGGTKIAPPEVDEILLMHPAVQAAAVFAVPDQRLGQDIVAAVVLERGQTVTPRELRRWMLDRLSPHKVPRRIWFRDSLPRTLSGKAQRGVLAQQFMARQTIALP